MKKWFLAISAIVLTAFVWLLPATCTVYAEGTETVSGGDTAIGESIESAIDIELGTENSVLASSKKYYKFEILEPGEYILEGCMQEFNYILYNGEKNYLKGKSFFATGSVKCSGEVLEFDSVGTYYILFCTTEAGTFSLQKVDIPQITVENTVSAETDSEHIVFYKFIPSETGHYSFTFIAPGKMEIWRVNGNTIYSCAKENTIYENMEAGVTYYFGLKFEEKGTFTARAEKIPEVTAMEITPTLRSTLYKGLDKWLIDAVVDIKLTLEDGSTDEVNKITDVEKATKYSLNSKYYTMDGAEISYVNLYNANVGKYYAVLGAGKLTSEPIYFEIKNPEDCDLVLKVGTTLTDLEGNKDYINDFGMHLFKLVIEEAGMYSVDLSKAGNIQIYDADLNYFSSGKGNTAVIETDAPAIYYVYAGAPEQFNITCTKLPALQSLTVSDDYRKVYINALSDNSVSRALQEMQFKGIFEGNKEMVISYNDYNWVNYKLSSTIYNSSDLQNPITIRRDLPIGDYVVKITDADGKEYCEIDFTVVNYQDIKNTLKVGQAINQTSKYQYYFLELDKADALYLDLGEASDANHKIRVYSSNIETNYGYLSADEKMELEAGKYFVRILNGNYPNACICTIKGNEIDIPVQSGDVETQLNSIIDLVASAEEKVSKIIETLKIDELCKTMQQKVSILVQISDLEKQYVADKKIEVTKPEVSTQVMDKDKITTVGAGLNADKGKVTLSVADATQKVELPSEDYHNMVALDIKLKVNDVTMSLLKIPVTITMPIPEGVLEEDLVIFHYASDGSIAEIIYPSINGEDKTFTFSVTHFSTFVLANEKDTVGVDDVEDEKANAEDSNNASESTESEAKFVSPKTRDDGVADFVLMAMISALALAFCGKKIRE